MLVYRIRCPAVLVLTDCISRQVDEAEDTSMYAPLIQSMEPWVDDGAPETTSTINDTEATTGVSVRMVGGTERGQTHHRTNSGSTASSATLRSIPDWEYEHATVRLVGSYTVTHSDIHPREGSEGLGH